MNWSSQVDAQVNTTVETFRVPSNGSTVEAKTKFKPRKIYRIIADGRVFVALGALADAEYHNISSTPLDKCQDDGVTDIGIGINSVPLVFGGGGKTNWWGQFNSSNRYETVFWIRKDDSSKVSFNYHDCYYGDNQDDFSDPLRIEIQVPQAGDCEADVSETFFSPSTVNGILILGWGRLFDHTKMRAHMCVGSAFQILFSSVDNKALTVEAPASVICNNTNWHTVKCAGDLEEAVKLTTRDSGHNKARSYTLVPVDPYK